jgi:hypothetical protein
VTDADVVAACLPTFLIIGAAKSGTTTVAAHLRSHPDVFVPEAKELYFFSSGPARDRSHDIGWYSEQFAAGASATARGEATPIYLPDPSAPAAVARTLPDAKIVALLREPVSRAWSHYWHARRRGVEHRSFSAALADERRGIDVVEFGYEATGRYVEHLRRWADHVPASSLHVVLLDDLERDPRSVYDGVCRFIGVDPDLGAPAFGEIHNRGHHVRSYRFHHVMWEKRIYPRLPERLAIRIGRLNHIDGLPPMPERVRDELGDRFKGPNRDLAAWLRRALPRNWAI